MGQKVNPIGLRLGINRTWDSRWYANTGEYGKLLHEDIKIRKYLMSELKQAAISKASQTGTWSGRMAAAWVSGGHAASTSEGGAGAVGVAAVVGVITDWTEDPVVSVRHATRKMNRRANLIIFFL